jgi:hypothetical protein
MMSSDIFTIQPPAAEKEKTEKQASAPRPEKEKAPVDPTVFILAGLGICSAILIGLLVFAHFVTKF